MNASPTLWIGFNVYVLAMLALDLGLFHRQSETVSVRSALIWSAVWIAQSLLFNAGIYYYHGTEIALEFLTGYLVEKSLSVDNLFVFLLIFNYFKVASEHQHRVLYWGVLGALVMRGVMIAAGAVLITRFHAVIYAFGALLVITAIRMLFESEPDVDPQKNLFVRVFRKLVPVTDQYHGSKFWIRENGKLVATPMMIVIIVVEVTDLIFAVDSIPAIFGITTDPFIVYSSNVFAILGLRSLYFALASVIDKFRFLNIGLALVLGFIGAKMLLSDVVKISTPIALGVVFGLLALSVIASLVLPAKSPGDDSTPEN